MEDDGEDWDELEKKAKKKDFAAVDHSRINYEPFRKEFYVPPPEIAAMTDDEAELLRLELDSIKIRGVDCPRPVTKWSYFGLHANVYVLLLFPVNGLYTNDIQSRRH